MTRRIVYLMSGPAHLPYLVVSLATLRSWYDGDAVVYAWPESYEFAKRIAADSRLSVEARLREPEYRGKNCQFLDKIKLMQSLAGEVEVAAYLDADTAIAGPIDELFTYAAEAPAGICLTQFCEWTTVGSAVRARIARLREFPAIDQTVVEAMLAGAYPSPNGGIFAARPESPVLPLWQRWTEDAISIFIADETVLHVILAHPEWCEKIALMRGGSFNCSTTRLQPKNLPDGKVRIWHFHGDSNVRPDKSPKGYRMWWPLYERCVKANVGGIAEWKDECGNKYIRAMENARVKS